MNAIIGNLETIPDYPVLFASLILVGAFIVAWIIEFVLWRFLAAAARKTQNVLDDKIIACLRRPIFYSILFYGTSWAVEPLELHVDAIFALYGVLKTATVLIWTSVAFKIGGLSLESLSHAAQQDSLLQKNTLPLFTMLLRATTFGIAVYFLFLAWDINVTAWLASAGIIGLAVGFAAQDTLANLFAGIFIIADAPYRLGDFIVLEDGIRGRVTQIGFRSTRLLTLDDIEITIPNSVIGGAKITNEVGGPDVRHRISVAVDAAYGSDVDLVRSVLLGCVDDISGVSKTPKPITRFLAFGASGLSFVLMVWIEDAYQRDVILDILHERVYKAFNAAGLEIPFSKHDLYIKEMPASFITQGEGASASLRIQAKPST